MLELVGHCVQYSYFEEVGGGTDFRKFSLHALLREFLDSAISRNDS
jgi:hypothetical protein